MHGRQTLLTSHYLYFPMCPLPSSVCLDVEQCPVPFLKGLNNIGLCHAEWIDVFVWIFHVDTEPEYLINTISAHRVSHIKLRGLLLSEK